MVRVSLEALIGVDSDATTLPGEIHFVTLVLLFNAAGRILDIKESRNGLKLKPTSTIVVLLE